MSAQTRFALLDQMIERYNAGDAEGYAAFFAKDGVEAMYRGAELRVGRDGVREGNAKTFADFPQNRAIVLERQAFGEYVTLHERVWRTPEGDPFEVLSIYSFAEGDKISRVEFVR
ncbi:nuclear transport factor 2 family protein [Sphingomonas natans]